MDSPFTRIDTVFLPVRNIEISTAWYEKVLRWPVIWRNEWVAAFRGEGRTALTLLKHDEGGETEFLPQASVAFNLFADDIDRARRNLIEAGVDAGPVMDHRGGIREFQFTDPDGNRLSVVNC